MLFFVLNTIGIGAEVLDTHELRNIYLKMEDYGYKELLKILFFFQNFY